MTSIEPRLLTREQVAVYLGCDSTQVDNLVKEGLIPPGQQWVPCFAGTAEP